MPGSPTPINDGLQMHHVICGWCSSASQKEEDSTDNDNDDNYDNGYDAGNGKEDKARGNGGGGGEEKNPKVRRLPLILVVRYTTQIS